MLQQELRRRIKTLKRIVPEEIAARVDVVIDLREGETIDLSGDDPGKWINDERIVDVARPSLQTPPRLGLGDPPPPAAAIFTSLNQIDREIAHLVAAGFSDSEIAGVLGTTQPQVRIAIRSMLSLAGYTSRAELIVGWHRG